MEKLESNKWVHIWNLDSDQTRVNKSFSLSHLSNEEKKRASEFINDKDALRYITAHYFLRRVLGSYLNVSPKELKFGRGMNNKPFIEQTDMPKLHFNLSYRESLFLAGISNVETVGVDVEKTRRIDNLNNFCKNHFSAREERMIEIQNSQNEKLSLLYTFWTMKEAVIKALGVGFTKPLTDYDVSDFIASPEFTPAFDKENTWTIRQINTLPDYKAAFAIKGTEIKVESFVHEGS